MSLAVLRDGFAAQSRGAARLGSPFMARLMALCAERFGPGGAVADRMIGWPGDPSPGADNLSMRLAGGLHALVIDGADPGLAAVYPPAEAGDDALWAAVAAAMRRHEGWLLGWLERVPQTNEVRRAAALIPAFHLIAAATGRPLALWEIGCSAGLNLRADRFALHAGPTVYGPADSALVLRPEWEGPAPTPAALAVRERRGADLAPLDPGDAQDRLRLRAYLWADQPERRRLTDAGIAIAGEVPVAIERAEATEWLARSLPLRPSGTATVLFHSIAWQYLSPEAQARGAATIAAAGADATASSPLAHLAMEGDGGPMAALTLRLWPGVPEPVTLARVDFHGRAVRWTGPVRL